MTCLRCGKALDYLVWRDEVCPKDPQGYHRVELHYIGKLRMPQEAKT